MKPSNLRKVGYEANEDDEGTGAIRFNWSTLTNGIFYVLNAPNLVHFAKKNPKSLDGPKLTLRQSFPFVVECGKQRAICEKELDHHRPTICENETKNLFCIEPLCIAEEDIFKSEW